MKKIWKTKSGGYQKNIEKIPDFMKKIGKKGEDTKKKLETNLQV